MLLETCLFQFHMPQVTVEHCKSTARSEHAQQAFLCVQCTPAAVGQKLRVQTVYTSKANMHKHSRLQESFFSKAFASENN
jgi:hypothetical protein